MPRYVVTDLTRFSNKTKVCTAVIDTESGRCFRPMPYLLSDHVQELNIHPGAIIEGDLTLKLDANNPHIEDANYQSLKYVDRTTSEEFESILQKTLSSSVAKGFGITFAHNQKHIPIGQQLTCSIVTIKISPKSLQIQEDQYTPGKIKASFLDNDRHPFKYLAITDRGFFDYAKKHQDDGKLADVQHFISAQKALYLRIGLSRAYCAPDGRDGYWLQVNGIYTFPEYWTELRTY